MNNNMPIVQPPAPAPAKKQVTPAQAAAVILVTIAIIVVAVVLGPKLMARSQIVGRWKDRSSAGGENVQVYMQFDKDGNYTLTAQSTKYSSLSTTKNYRYTIGWDGTLTLWDGGIGTVLEYDSSKKGVGGKWYVDGNSLYIGEIHLTKV